MKYAVEMASSSVIKVHHDKDFKNYYIYYVDNLRGCSVGISDHK
jgi:hypothetical protein